MLLFAAFSQVVKCVYTVTESASECKCEFHKAHVHRILARKVDKNNLSAATVHVTVHFAGPISVQTIISDSATFLVSCLTIVIMCYLQMKVQVKVRSAFNLDCHQRRTSCTFSGEFPNFVSQSLSSNKFFPTGIVCLLRLLLPLMIIIILSAFKIN